MLFRSQMSLFTAGGLLNGLTQCIFDGENPAKAYRFVKEAYIEWVDTQTGIVDEHPNCWFSLKPFMNEQRAPGNTCISVLNRMKYGESSRKYSKGCGGVMRTAPVALFFAGLHDKGYDKTGIMDEAAIAGHLAWLTHRHLLVGILHALCILYLQFFLKVATCWMLSIQQYPSCKILLTKEAEPERLVL